MEKRIVTISGSHRRLEMIMDKIEIKESDEVSYTDLEYLLSDLEQLKEEYSKSRETILSQALKELIFAVLTYTSTGKDAAKRKMISTCDLGRRALEGNQI
jgi:hypothetical protein